MPRLPALGIWSAGAMIHYSARGSTPFRTPSSTTERSFRWSGRSPTSCAPTAPSEGRRRCSPVAPGRSAMRRWTPPRAAWPRPCRPRGSGPGTGWPSSTRTVRSTSRCSSAARKLNAVNVAVNWRLAPAEMAYTINDAEARLLFVGPDFFSHVEEIEGKLGTVETIIALGAHSALSSVRRTGSRRRRLATSVRRSAPDDVAMQLYTSGTTGLPKGAMLTNGNLGTLMPNVSVPWEARRHVGQPGRDAAVPHRRLRAGRSCGMYKRLSLDPGAGVRAAGDPRRPRAPPRDQRPLRARHAPVPLGDARAPPTATTRRCARSCTAPRRSPTRCSLRAMRTFRCPFIQVYGLTETHRRHHRACPSPTTIRRARGRGSCARPASRTRGWRCGSSTRTPVATARPDEVGELWTRSVQNMKGYWKKPEETARVLTAGRLAQDRRRGLHGRRGLRLPHRSREGHDRVGRREHLSRRGRERALGPSRHRRRRGDRRAATSDGARPSRRSWSGGPAPTRPPTTSSSTRASGSPTTSARPSVDFAGDAAPQPVGQAPEAPAPRALLEGPRAADQLRRVR